MRRLDHSHPLGEQPIPESEQYIYLKDLFQPYDTIAYTSPAWISWSSRCRVYHA